MWNHFVRAWVVVALVGASGCATKSSSSEDPFAIVRAVILREEAAVEAKDAAVMASLYAPDGLLQNGSSLSKGRDAIQKYREAGFRAGFYKEDISVTEAVLVGDVIYDAGEFTAYINGANGPFQIKGRWGGALVRSGGIWRIGMVTISVPPPPARE